MVDRFCCYLMLNGVQSRINQLRMYFCLFLG